MLGAARAWRRACARAANKRGRAGHAHLTRLPAAEPLLRGVALPAEQLRDLPHLAHQREQKVPRRMEFLPATLCDKGAHCVAHSGER